jgi:Arc/MetJ-type ribon-helix-helix transcriptional regulator
MAKEKFGVAVDKEIVQEVDELVAECDDLGASRSEIVEAILTAFIQTESDHAQQLREIIIPKTKGHSLTYFTACAPSARYFEPLILYNYMKRDYSVVTFP